MRKKAAFIALVVLLMCQISFAYELPLKIKLNDYFLHTDTEHEVVEGRVYIPLRVVADAMGATLEWEQEIQAARFILEDYNILFGENHNLSIRMDAYVQLDTGAFIKNGVMYVAVRPLFEYFGGLVGYDSTNRTVVIELEGLELPEHYRAIAPYDEESHKALSKIVFLESRGGSLERSLAVANVIMNRVASSRFPNTVREVIYQPGQFPPVVRFDFDAVVPDAQSVYAAQLALEGVNNMEGALFFNNRPFSWKSRQDLIKIIEGEYFYY